ncbi:MAG: hypothetical protein LBP59_07935 [Planctomycetaceae bacterium]|jgi:hypothetical protein|nr:hypothetical protein [Planctomycetaceae bacterium]
MRLTIFSFVLGLFIFAAGCSGGGNISGKVTFTDGQPLEIGEVRLESGSNLFSGKIQSGGYYQINSSNNNGIKIPNGSYKVSVYALDYSGIEVVIDPDKESPPPKSFVATKFQSGETSGIICEVKGNTTFDVTVEKP